MENVQTLKARLENFSFEGNDIQKLTEKFQELAPYFLYDGYIKVRNEFKVFIRSIEFYFHSEENGIHDPIVYHRNGHGLEHVPYFPTMTLHAHNSGFDITFEKEGYRVSALIRAYDVWDGHNYLKWNTDKKMFIVCTSDDCTNTQSTYLYTLINGFSLGNRNDIVWENEIREKKMPITSHPRQNVPLYVKLNAENVFEEVTEDHLKDNSIRAIFDDQIKNDPFNRDQVSNPQYFTYNKKRCLKDLKPWQFKREETFG